jgi:hypothetical protein
MEYLQNASTARIRELNKHIGIIAEELKAGG